MSKERLNELIADNFLEIGTSGRNYSKEDILEKLSQQAETKLALKDFNAMEISPDTILTTYQIEKEILGSNEKTFSSRSSI